MDTSKPLQREKPGRGFAAEFCLPGLPAPAFLPLCCGTAPWQQYAVTLPLFSIDPVVISRGLFFFFWYVFGYRDPRHVHRATFHLLQTMGGNQKPISRLKEAEGETLCFHRGCSLKGVLHSQG